MAYISFPKYEDFGSASNLGQNENDTFEFDNLGGYSSIAFRCTAPTGGEVTFEATFDGTNWEAVSMRSVANDMFQQITDNDSDFLGSISGARKFRWRTSSAGSGAGTIMGRAQRDASTLEGIEFGHPPHRFGFDPVHKDASYTTAQTAVDIWTPASGKKFVVTDMIMNFSGATDALVKIFDETDSTGNYLYKANVDVSLIGGGKPQVICLKTPFVSSAADNDLKLTTDADIDLDLTIHGYEI